MEQEELNEIIALHLKWLRGEVGGKRADLYKANLSNTDLRYVNLSKANLSKANLSKANLGKANLRYANLYNANLGNTDLRYANLGNTDLRYANLRYANLYNANLYNANLSNADLYNANLLNAQSILSFIGEQHLLVYFKYDETYYCKIGCKDFPVEYWIKNFQDIGISEGYSLEQTRLYGDVIKLFSQYDLLEK